MTDRISAALEAARKITSGRWVVGGKYTVRISESSTNWICRTRDEHHKHSDEEDAANATLIAAAPDLAAEVIRLRKWQAEAVELMRPLVNADRSVGVEHGHYTYSATGETSVPKIAKRLIAEAEGE